MPSSRSVMGAGLAIVALLAVGVRTAEAQIDAASGPKAIEFNFSNPGARSLGMAGALTGAGDDATGAWTNPAGLTNLTRPEIGVEWRGFNFSTRFVERGRFLGTPTGTGIDTVNGLAFGQTSEGTNSLSFVSAVLPKSRFAFAAYRTEVANFRSQSVYQGAFIFLDNLQYRSNPMEDELELKISNAGGAAAVRLTDQLSVGVGVSVYDLDLHSTTQIYDPNDSPGGFWAAFGRTQAGLLWDEQTTGDDRAVGVNVGVSLNPHERVRIGASFRRGAKFETEYSGAAPGFSPLEESGTFRVPDVTSVGALLKPLDQLNVTLDVRRVQYSQIVRGQGTLSGEASEFAIDDGTEIRAAAEYIFTDLPSPLSAIALRAGVWRDPDHRIRYVGPPLSNSIRFQPGKDETHFTGGAGVVFERVQFDVGFDSAESIKTFALSAVVRF